MSNPEIRAALDTSVVMRLLTGQPSELAHVARVYLDETEQLKAKVYVPNLVIMEAYFACQHHYHMPKAAVIQGLHTYCPSQPSQFIRNSSRFSPPTDSPLPSPACSSNSSTPKRAAPISLWSRLKKRRRVCLILRF